MLDLTKAQHLFEEYLDNIMGFIEKKKVPVTTPSGTKYRRPDETLMRAIEEHCDIPEQSADDFRRMIMTFVGMQTLKGRPVNYPYPKG